MHPAECRPPGCFGQGDAPQDQYWLGGFVMVVAALILMRNMQWSAQ